MNPLRSALAAGTLYALPLLVWLLGSLHGLERPAAIGTLLDTGFALLVPLQALTIALFTPVLVLRTGFTDALTAILLLIALPWPLLALCAQGGGIGLPLILASQALLLAWGLVLTVAVHLPPPRTLPLATPLVQLAGLALVLGGSGPWLAWSLPA